MVWGEDVPEFSMNTVRVRVTCKYPQIGEERFKVHLQDIDILNNKHFKEQFRHLFLKTT